MQWIRSGIEILLSRTSLAVWRRWKNWMTMQNWQKSNGQKILM